MICATWSYEVGGFTLWLNAAGRKEIYPNFLSFKAHYIFFSYAPTAFFPPSRLFYLTPCSWILWWEDLLQVWQMQPSTILCLWHYFVSLDDCLILNIRHGWQAWTAAWQLMLASWQSGIGYHLLYPRASWAKLVQSTANCVGLYLSSSYKVIKQESSVG